MIICEICEKLLPFSTSHTMKMTVARTSHSENGLGQSDVQGVLAGVLSMFLNFNQNSGSCSYKIGCYQKKGFT